MSAAVERMNVLELIEAHPTLFYRQSWYVGEAFLRILPDDDAYDIPPRRVIGTGQVAKSSAKLPRAVDLLHAFVKRPADAIWQYYLWTADTDRHGQRVYIGVNDGRMEIHRHIHLTERFGTPAWL